MPSRRDCLRAVGAGGLAAVAGCVSADPVEGRWPRAGYDDRNTGNPTDVDGPGRALTQSWSTDVPTGRFAASPVVADGRLFVGYGQPRPEEGPPRVGVRVLDAASGDTVRDVEVTTYDGERTGGAVFRDSLVVADGALYLVAYDGVHSFTLDGGRRWHVPVDGTPNNTIHRAAHPVVAHGTVYAPTASVTDDTDAAEGLLAVDDASGEVRWRYAVPVEGTSARGWTYPPAFADGTVYVSALDHGVVALDPASGDVQWETRVPSTGSPTVAGGRVFVPTEDETGASFVVALDAASGEAVWRRGSGGERLGRELAAGHGYVYYRESLETLVCRYAASGRERWRNTAPEGVALTRPVVTDDALYAGARMDTGGDDGIATFHPGVGELLDFAGFGGRAGRETPLAVADGRLFATTSTGRAYAFEACSLDLLGYCLY